MSPKTWLGRTIVEGDFIPYCTSVTTVEGASLSHPMLKIRCGIAEQSSF